MKETKFYINENEIYFYKDDVKYNVNKNDNNEIKNLAIVGSRNINNQEFVNSILEKFKYIFGLPKRIISGGAKGIDTIGEQWAIKNNIETQIFKPDWAKFGKKAGFIRNEDIIKNCDICFAIWDGESHGTKNDIELCEKYEKDLILFNAKESTQETLYVFYYKQYNKELEIDLSDTGDTQMQQKTPVHQITNRWLPQQGIISL